MKNKIKVFMLVSLLVVVFATSVVFSEDKKTLVWIEWIGSEAAEGVTESAIALFEEQNPGIKIERLSFAYGPVHDKVVQLNMAQRCPDVIQVVSRWVAEFADNEIVQPIDKYLDREGSAFVADLAPAIMVPWKDHRYIVPIVTGGVMLFYNKDIFAKYGVEKVPTTWEELLAVAQKVNDPANGIYAFTGNMNLEPATCVMYEVWPFILQAGADLVKDGKAVFNTDQGAEGLQFFVDLVNKYNVVTPGTLSSGEKEKRENFSTGKIAMMFEGGAGITIQTKRNPDLNFGVASLPTYRRAGSVLSGWNLAMSASTKYPEEAWEFMKFMSNGGGAEIISRETKQIPGSVSLSKKDFIQNDPRLKLCAETAVASTSVSLDQLIPAAMELRKLFTIEIQEALMEKKTAKQALDDAAEKWNEALTKSNK